MYGETGWCHSCGTPLHEQSGSLTLQAGGQSPVHGAWVPNWRFDAICLEKSLADRASAEFRVDLKPIAWRRKVIGAAMQIVAPTVGPAWFDPDELRQRATARHGSAGNECPECRVWRVSDAVRPAARGSPRSGLGAIRRHGQSGMVRGRQEIVPRDPHATRPRRAHRGGEPEGLQDQRDPVTDLGDSARLAQDGRLALTPRIQHV